MKNVKILLILHDILTYKGANDRGYGYKEV